MMEVFFEVILTIVGDLLTDACKNRSIPRPLRFLFKVILLLLYLAVIGLLLFGGIELLKNSLLFGCISLALTVLLFIFSIWWWFRRAHRKKTDSNSKNDEETSKKL